MTDENRRFGPVSPINLLEEADFSLGASRVSPSSLEVSRAGLHETLEPRIMQVLVALHQANGRVVSRDELIARCWEGRVVGEDAITRAVGRLRRLSEADGGASFVVETIPKIGFRLVPGGGSQFSGEPAEPLPPSTNLSSRPAAAILPPRRQSRLPWAATGIGAVLVAGTAAWLLWPAPRWTVESSRPFISTLALEGEPAFSPNGAMLAYASGADTRSRKIYVRNMAGGDGIKVTGDAYDDVSPSWSSDGARLAYIAQKTGEPCRIMVATVPAGEVREAGRCAQAETSSVAWQPGTPFLYYSDLRGARRAVFRLDLDTGASQQILVSDKDGNCVCDLHISPNGKWLAYLRNDSVEFYSIVIRDLAGGKEKVLGTISQTAAGAWGDSAAWSEDSKTVLVSGSSGIGSEIMAYPLDGGTPYRIYVSAMGISHLSVGGGGLLALESNIIRRNLARASATPIAQPDIIDPANNITFSPSFASDGTLAFISNRSGTNALWTMKPGAAPVQIFDAGVQSLYRENFSPNGTRLATVINTANGDTVKILTADGASVASFDLPSVGRGLPTWTPDGKGLIVFDSKIQRAFRIAADNPAQREPIAASPWIVREIRNNGTFAVRFDKRGLWQIDNGTRLISGKYSGPLSVFPAFRGDDVLIADFNAAGGPRILAQPVTGGPDRVIAYAPGAEDRNYKSMMAVSPKTGEIIYVASILNDTNIDLLTLRKR